eukprot:CAMPEP_0198326990 /NCGR_PEP_ID=MMETSP1450-20131203/14361_1 /TAXON_ID=753684 ORGANISM="Madagascaria erythrocladiodes, Strain CCMP3234" /NCGR_SAMPLE_ID=MMETSP1450 /ASSEMBLY_ACC=CAM_ASM_001115 /LENGTH=151 /DNA_ID=CAMNT_0044030999 /DNA_START=70 /DNA_END=521 /DNA_ORIENTATION=-
MADAVRVVALRFWLHVRRFVRSEWPATLAALGSAYSAYAAARAPPVDVPFEQVFALLAEANLVSSAPNTLLLSYATINDDAGVAQVAAEFVQHSVAAAAACSSHAELVALCAAWLATEWTQLHEHDDLRFPPAADAVIAHITAQQPQFTSA